MLLVNIIVFATLLGLIVFLIIFSFFFFRKYKKIALSSITRDLNIVNQNYNLHIINAKELPVTLTDYEINDDIYCYNRIVIGEYEKPKKIIVDNNSELTLSGFRKIKFFYHNHLMRTFSKEKFNPLNKIDLLVTAQTIYLLHPLDSEVIDFHKINKFVIFWEKNALAKGQEYFPAIAFNYNKHSYFFLFLNYNELLQFIACINNLILKKSMI